MTPKFPQYDDIKTATEEVKKTIDNNFVIQNPTIGYNEELSKGVSIYFPSDKEHYSPDYSGLLFSNDHQLDKLLGGFFNNIMGTSRRFRPKP